MSDFIDHLFPRSFILDSSSQNVRPRLPSLFETPLNEQQKLIMPFAANPEQTNAGRDSTPGDERESVAPAARFSSDFAATVWPNTNLSPARRNPQDGKRYSTSDLPDSHGRLRNDEQITHTVNNPGRSAGHKPAAESFQPLSRVDSFATMESIAFPENRESFSLFPERSLQFAGSRSEIDPLATGKPDYREKVENHISGRPVLKHIVALNVDRQNLSSKDDTLGLVPKRIPSLRAPANAAELRLPRLSAEVFDRKRETIAEPAEQVINVTIGRIEVRATQAAPISGRKNQAPKAATMSLDDYLNKRNGGVR